VVSWRTEAEMAKKIRNPINPEMGSSEYEQYVGYTIEKLANDPGFVHSLFKHLIDDHTLLESLAELHLKRTTAEKPKWRGASGYEHQIDESFSTEDEKVIILIECKHWATCIDLPAFSAFLVRVIDIASEERGNVVLGILVTTQGHKGRAGGEDQGCISRLQTYFSRIGYPIEIQWLPD
jgi:hypothetical protein